MLLNRDLPKTKWHKAAERKDGQKYIKHIQAKIELTILISKDVIQDKSFKQKKEVTFCWKKIKITTTV